MTELVKLYNPANASVLTQQQIEGLQKLTSEQIKELAKAYPNLTMQRAYLLIIDSSKPVDKQIPNLSTFENLWNLREKNGQRKYVAYMFRGTYKIKESVNVKSRKQEVVDLSDQELLSLPGFKTENYIQEPMQVKKVTVKKEKIDLLKDEVMKGAEFLKEIKSE